MANMTEATAQGSLAHKPNIKDLEMVSDGSDDEDEAEEGLGGDSYGDDDDMEDGESDIEDDMGGA